MTAKSWRSCRVTINGRVRKLSYSDDAIKKLFLPFLQRLNLPFNGFIIFLFLIGKLQFSFPSGILSDREYRYEVGFFFVLGWEALCAGFAFLLMVKNCRIPHSRRIRWLPLVPFALSLAYAYMYVKNVYCIISCNFFHPR